MPEPLAALERLAVEHVRRVAREIVTPGLSAPPGEHHWTSSSQVHTQGDEAAGAALQHLFAESFPGHGLVIEDRESVAGDGVHQWWIDPIDGSANHLRGIPYVAMSAGLAVDGEPVVGVVHDVVRGLTVSASRGGGARVFDGTSVRAVRVAPTQRLAEAMTVVHLARRGPIVGLPGALNRILWSVRKIRCMGSIAMDLLLLATGEIDLIVSGRGEPQRRLDILGGCVLVREAGGRLLTAEGREMQAHSRTLVAGAPWLCEQFVQVMAGFDLEGWEAEQAAPPD